MTYSALILLAPMLFVAQTILTLVLQKGEICPGQRGRVHKLLPASGVLWLAIASVEVSAFLISAALFYFYSQVKTGKTRDEGPLWVMWLADMLALLFVGYQLKQFDTVSAGLFWFIFAAMSGALFAHLNLLLARSRLEAFHQLLPVSGVISGIAGALVLSLPLISLSDAAIEPVLNNFLSGFALLISGLVIWCWHLFRKVKPAKAQLSVALLLIYISGICFWPLLQL